MLDPFLGSGTTTLAAKNLGRNSAGYEINEQYLTVIKEKIGFEQKSISGECAFELLYQTHKEANFKEEIRKLPYVFNDPVKFDKKIDPRRLQFGSKIDANGCESENGFSVKEVVSPELLVLNTGAKVRLLGIRALPENSGAAVRFLEEKTRRQKVFLKFDSIKYDENNNLLCYLYLDNKTFLNAHLIKKGLADVDTARDYKYKEKFLSEKMKHGERMDFEPSDEPMGLEQKALCWPGV